MTAFDWFLGRNDLNVALANTETGSCRDGLHRDRPNENQGAESVLSYLLGLSEIRRLVEVGGKTDRNGLAPSLALSA